MKTIGLQCDSEIICTGITYLIEEKYDVLLIREVKEGRKCDLLIYEKEEFSTLDLPRIKILRSEILPFPITESLITLDITKNEFHQAVETTLGKQIYIEDKIQKILDDLYLKADILKSLSTREIILVQGLLQGKRNKDLAKHLFISEKTVKNNLTELYKKMNVKNRKDLEKKYKKLLTVKK